MGRLTSVSVRPQRTPLRVLALVFVLLATMIAANGVSAGHVSTHAGPGSTSYELVTGSEGDRSIPLVQAGVLAGDSPVYVSPAEGIVRVRYYLDPSARDLELGAVGGKPVAIATEPPFALRSGEGFDTSTLAAGSHTLVAAIDLVDGRTVVKTARGQVLNDGQALLFKDMPANLAATPDADCAPLACSQVKVVVPYVLTFDQNHGGLTDKNGVGTGFTWVDKPTAGGTGYIPANLEVDTAAGLLKITTTPGIAFLGDNNQDNTLGVGIDAGNQISVLETRLLNFPAMTGNLEQAGLWYGADDDNYLKLVVIYEPGGPRVQFVEERNGLLQQQVVSDVIPLTGAVQLRMRANPGTQTVTAYYGLSDGPLQELHRFIVPPALFNAGGAVIDPELGTRVFGGVFASDRFLQGVNVFQFDYFTLTAEASQVIRAYLPVVTRAGP